MKNMSFKKLSIDEKMQITRLRLQTDEDDEKAVETRNKIEAYFAVRGFYDELEEAVKGRFVLTDPSRIKLRWAYDLNILHNQTKISFKHPDGDDGTLEIYGFQAAGIYILENEQIERQELDFATLVTEKREQIWKEAVNDLAKVLVQRLERMLDTLVTKAYGLNSTETLDIGRRIGDPGYQASLVLAYDDDPEWLKKLQLCQLSHAQLMDLTNAVNGLISHAKITFMQHRNAGFVMTVYHREDNEVEDAIFDYGEYLRNNATVSPELEQMFDAIVQNLEKAPDQMTLSRFDGMGRLIFKFDQEQSTKWWFFEDQVFKQGKHWGDLVKRIEESNPGIKIVKDDKYGPNYMDDKLVFVYELTENAPDDLRQSCALEDAIRKIIETKSMDIAKSNVNRILDAINGNSTWAKDFRRRRHVNEHSALFIIHLNEYDERLEDIPVDITKVLNRDWLEKLNRLHHEITGPDLSIKFLGYGEYQIDWGTTS